MRSINMAVWLLDCPCSGMKQITTVRRLLRFLVLLTPMGVVAGGLAIAPPVPAESLAFARYIASLHERDLFTESGPVEIVIDASLPGLHKQSREVAIRQTGESERGEYRVLQNEGDATVSRDVIAPYLAAQKQIDDMPRSSVQITPANYTFRYMGEFLTGGSSTYVFRIRPKNKRQGLIKGQLWIDSVTGVAVMQAGYFVKASSPVIRRIEIVRDTQLLDGHPSVRITRLRLETRRAGRGYLTITEFPPAAAAEESGIPIAAAQRQ